MTELTSHALTWLAWTLGGLALVFGAILLWRVLGPGIEGRAAARADAAGLDDPPWERPRPVPQTARGHLALRARLDLVEARDGPHGETTYLRDRRTGQLWRGEWFDPAERRSFGKNDREYELVPVDAIPPRQGPPPTV